MLKQFKYTKQPSGDISYRTVYPLRNVDNKLLSIDMSDMSDAERAEAIETLDAIHKRYVAEVSEAGFDNRYRYFFLDQMS